MTTQNELLEIAYHDEVENLAEITYLLTDCQEKLAQFNQEIARINKHLLPSVQKYIEEQSTTLEQQLIAHRSTISTLPVTLEALKQVSQSTKELKELVRIFVQQLAALITSTDWQSPSFMHSVHSLAGRQTGKIIGHVSDYKRDQHRDAHQYERAFVKAYAHTWLTFPIHAYVTNSGMAAMTTILAYLVGEKKINSTLIGSSIYFENKELIKKILPGEISEVAEQNTQQLVEIINQKQPDLVVFDSICNASGVPTPDLPILLQNIAKIKKPTTVIIDNTTRPLFSQPFSYFSTFSRHTVLIVESLNKYHQFGLDRVTGGIILARGQDVGKLYSYREHLGTILTDFSSVALPSPNQALLKKRLLRLGRNNQWLAQQLQTAVTKTAPKKLAGVSYPYHLHPFGGSFMTLDFKPHFQTVSWYSAFVKKCIAEAHKHQVRLVSGTSFGLDTTRIYLTAEHSDYGEPFVRIAAGTENQWELTQLAAVFTSVIAKL